jgi:hypothetical protein
MKEARLSGSLLNKPAILIAAIAFFALSCTNDQYETDPCAEISYTTHLKSLVNTRCAIPGCHVAGFQPGDLTSYESLKVKAENGKLKMMVLDLNLMPPVDKLSEAEKQLFRCWIANVKM